MILYATEDIYPGQHILYLYGPNYQFSGEQIKISDLMYEDGLNTIPEETNRIKEEENFDDEFPIYI